MSHPKSFLAGLEESLARIISVALTVLIGGVYVSGRDGLNLQVVDSMQLLGAFWLVYEILSYIFFLMFKFFAGSQEKSEDSSENSLMEASEEKPQETDTYQSIHKSETIKASEDSANKDNGEEG
jgi:hypothetical protein